MIQFVPAIIPQSYQELRNTISRVRSFSLIQIDILDGIAVKNVRSWPYTNWKEFEPIIRGDEGLPFWQDVSHEVHLMCRTHTHTIEEWIASGVSSIVIHPSFCNNIESIWEMCAEHNISLWHAVLPQEASTPQKAYNIANDYKDLFLKYYEPRLATEPSQAQGGIQIMGNDEIGKHGVDLDKNVFNIILSFKESGIENIAIDIGVNENTWKSLVKAGATKLISGSMIFGSDNPEQWADF